MRLKAAREAGVKEIWIDVADWSEEKQREFIIKDNSGFGEWDWDILANEWDQDKLNDWGLNIDNTNTSFNEEDDILFDEKIDKKNEVTIYMKMSKPIYDSIQDKIQKLIKSNDSIVCKILN